MTESNLPGSGQDLSETAIEIAKRRQAAANEVIAMLEEQYDTIFASHAGTLLRAAAWLAGTSLYRSFGFKADIAPGSPVLSDKANEEGPKLLKVFMFLVDKLGIKLKPDGFISEIPAEQGPNKDIVQVQEMFQERYNEIMKQHGFDYADGARTGAVTCALLVNFHCVRRKISRRRWLPASSRWVSWKGRRLNRRG